MAAARYRGCGGDRAPLRLSAGLEQGEAAVRRAEGIGDANTRHETVNPYLFRDTLLKLIGAENLPYEQLVSRSN